MSHISMYSFHLTLLLYYYYIIVLIYHCVINIIVLLKYYYYCSWMRFCIQSPVLLCIILPTGHPFQLSDPGNAHHHQRCDKQQGRLYFLRRQAEQAGECLMRNVVGVLCHVYGTGNVRCPAETRAVCCSQFVKFQLPRPTHSGSVCTIESLIVI